MAKPTSSLDETAVGFCRTSADLLMRQEMTPHYPQDIYGMHVTQCLVRDGLGWSEQGLINEEGCPQVHTSKITITIVITILFNANLTLVHIRITRSWAS